MIKYGNITPKSPEPAIIQSESRGTAGTGMQGLIGIRITQASDGAGIATFHTGNSGNAESNEVRNDSHIPQETLSMVQ